MNQQVIERQVAKLDGDQVLRLRGDERCMPDRVVGMGERGLTCQLRRWVRCQLDREKMLN